MSKLQATGESLYASQEKVSSELLTMTYGAMVTQLLADYKDIHLVNAELERMGYSIGVRLIDEFLSKANIQSCRDFRETCNVIAKVAFKMFLGITADCGKWSDDGRSCSIIFKGNPLTDFVELPVEFINTPLQYSNLLCGVIRGALHLIQMVVVCEMTHDELKGSEASEIRVTLKDMLTEQYNDEEDG
jgi:hypothetical protein